MKITEIKTFLMQAGTPGAGAWSSDSGAKARAGSRNWLFVQVHTDAGIHGTGECSGWPRVVETAVNDLASLLIGEDPAHIERLWQRMMGAMNAHGMSGVVGAGAMSGLEMALWDIKGKALGTPVWNLLGGKVRDRVRLYAHAGTPERAKELVARGFTAIKTGGVAGTVEKVAAIRAAVGDAVDLMADLAGPPWLTPKDAIALGRALETYKLLFFEDPVAPEFPDGLKRVQDAIDIPIAAGERFATLWGLRPLIQQGIVDVVQPDTGRAGGIGQMMKIAALAEANFVTLAPHSGTLGPVAEFAALHVMAAVPNALMLERMEDDWEGRREVVTPVLEAEDGWMAVPDAPGLGVEIVPDAIARYPSTGNVAFPRNPGDGTYAEGTGDEQVYFQSRFTRGRDL